MDEDRQLGGGRSDALNARADGRVRGRDDPAPEPLPRSLRLRLEACADQWLDECAGQSAAPRAEAVARSTALPWAVAAASIMLAVAGWWPRVMQLDSEFDAAGGFGQWRAQRARTAMLGDAGVGHWAWREGAGRASGDVVWDARRQQGFLRLRGFAANDPARAQYQLWIFDSARDDRYPVDGGVFDVPAGRHEVVVPMHPTLPVSRAVAFAITVERPGGAVVSSREQVVAFAQAGP